ncbi:MAG: EamA family transporter [Flavobacteriaceae bacterium CG_4_8_14_3_um_filter_34_10]|nr:DMT family transporter [Flavobacteriia bacterium]OIP51294.1 MAG: EamA family transporter [Flavobacteriaceae bacterium CG2_30_34_30]PIQ18700.1 MAG: EamA family transporter [Flavobacteriaceae bacterium CG18_big_fil_WC_8_21_14_2_50_34_36]PIV48750.1 MAG: EamA family transporter [Flavobacteriaceae bacterium CG02_land_8_20_14_3_00_34_13]PIX09323.1 MAG: EamA family transporter [Flavobacteriaceae bacterium CG_4_8_14_3_um_filter_34_10]PIZ08143.1 MAG: EamA family transporter [Flavobacteriaceae bacter
MNKRFIALLAATTASTIYAINHTIAKGLMPVYIEPYGFILLRVSGAAALFWIFSLAYPSEKIDLKDWKRLVACSLFGMVINMLMFFKGLSLSTPINSSVVITISPVLLLVLSAILIKERITLIKSIGIILGLVGALVLVFFGETKQFNAPNIPLGNILFIVNAISYSIYLILVKSLTAKYSSITLMKWLFLFAFLMNLPIGISEFMEVKWTSLPNKAMLGMAFVVVFTTVLTYLLNIYALRELKASTIGAFIYLQPVIAVIFAVLLGVDQLTPLRVLAAILIFIGVYLSSIKPKRD